jgi:uncharacterized protein YndB with AHSA1/START domain
MTTAPIHHATIVLEHRYNAPPNRVYAEFANPVVRAKWSAASDDELIYDESAFKIGGRDVFRCGPRGDLKFQGETIYHFIAPDSCVISTETLQAGGQNLAVSLNTMELQEIPEGTNLKLTVQIASFVGEGLVKGFESGNRGALEGLASHLAKIS